MPRITTARYNSPEPLRHIPPYFNARFMPVQAMNRKRQEERDILSRFHTWENRSDYRGEIEILGTIDLRNPSANDLLLVTWKRYIATITRQYWCLQELSTPSWLKILAFFFPNQGLPAEESLQQCVEEWITFLPDRCPFNLPYYSGPNNDRALMVPLPMAIGDFFNEFSPGSPIYFTRRDYQRSGWSVPPNEEELAAQGATQAPQEQATALDEPVEHLHDDGLAEL